MVYLYSGTPGSYKSYHAVSESLRWLRGGYNVITNFPLNYSKVIKKPIKGVYNYVNSLDLTTDYLINFAVKHHHKGVKAQTLVIFDEAAIKFNSRDFGRYDRLDWINFFNNHRHFNFDIILISQSDIMLDKQIRASIEIEYKFRQVTHYKLLGRCLGLIMPGLHLYYDFWYVNKMPNMIHWCGFSKRVASCYDTMQLFIGSKSMDKMSAYKKSMNKEEKTIVEISDPRKQKQVHKDLSKFCSLLHTYIQYHQCCS